MARVTRLRAVAVAVTMAAASAVPLVLPPAPSGAQSSPTGLCDRTGVSRFSDVDPEGYGAEYVLCMKALGLSAGKGDNNYGPDLELNRGQAASFLVRLWRDTLDRTCPTGAPLPFTDVEGSVHAESIACLFRLGITTGTTATTFSPRDPLKASQVSRFLYRVYRRTGNTCAVEVTGSELSEAVDCLVSLNVVPTAAEASSPTPVTRVQMGVYLIGLWHNLTGRGLPPTPPQLPTETATIQPASPEPDTTTLRLAYELVSDYRAPLWSPDSTRVAYGGTDGLWVADADGTNRNQLVANDISYDPSNSNTLWSPDGTRIAYADRDGGVWVASADGNNPQQITVDGRHPFWSPDGAKISYTKLSEGADYSHGGSDFWVINADGTNPRRITASGWDLRWAPDSTRVTYSTLDGIWVVNADGTNPQRITADGWDPRWAPDSTRITYTVGGFGTGGVWTVNSDGTDPQRIATTGRYPRWSPDSTRIAYTVSSDYGVWITNADGTNPQRIATSPGRSVRWSPDGTRLAYGALGGIWVVPAMVTRQHQNHLRYLFPGLQRGGS